MFEKPRKPEIPLPPVVNRSIRIPSAYDKEILKDLKYPKDYHFIWMTWESLGRNAAKTMRHLGIGSTKMANALEWKMMDGKFVYGGKMVQISRMLFSVMKVGSS